MSMREEGMRKMIYRVTETGKKKLLSNGHDISQLDNIEILGKWDSPNSDIYSFSKSDIEKTVDFLELEAKCDDENHQEMLNVVDLTTLTKAKITALGKLGEKYKKESKALIKKYKQSPEKFFAKEKAWL